MYKEVCEQILHSVLILVVGGWVKCPSACKDWLQGARCDHHRDRGQRVHRALPDPPGTLCCHNPWRDFDVQNHSQALQGGFRHFFLFYDLIKLKLIIFYMVCVLDVEQQQSFHLVSMGKVSPQLPHYRGEAICWSNRCVAQCLHMFPFSSFSCTAFLIAYLMYFWIFRKEQVFGFWSYFDWKETRKVWDRPGLQHTASPWTCLFGCRSLFQSKTSHEKRSSLYFIILLMLIVFCPKQGPTVTVSVPSVDFGLVRLGEQTRTTFLLTNTSNLKASWRLEEKLHPPQDHGDSQVPR